MSEPLGRVLDPATLDQAGGARGRYRIEVPVGWARAGEEVDLSVPARLVCARCDGGGCDGCNRSGVVRGPDDPAARTLRIRLPPGEGVALRIARPFDGSPMIDQLILEISQGSCASEGVVLVRRSTMAGPPHGRPFNRVPSIVWPAVMIAIATGLLLACLR
jgi:hypothetical protein